MQWVSTATSRQLIFADWVVVRRDSSPPVILLLALRFLHEEDGPIRKLAVVDIGMSLDELEDKVQRVTPARLQSGDWQRVLSGLGPLVEPLGEIANENDILILSLTAPLHNLLLHALPLSGQPLLKRNP